MFRRAVLSKVGLQFGAAALLALSVDDLARKVTATIAARNKDSEVAQAVAQEFKNAGLAFANVDSYGCAGCSESCEADENSICEDCGPNCRGKKKKWVPCPGKESCAFCARKFYYSEDCKKAPSQLNCCDDKCFDCCVPGPGKPVPPCKGSANDVWRACQVGCSAVHEDLP